MDRLIRNAAMALGVFAAALSVSLSVSSTAQAQRYEGLPSHIPRPSGEKAPDAANNASQSVVTLLAISPEEAASSATLGRQRSGSGVIIAPNIVLTIGYLILEADQVMVVTADGKRIPGSPAGYDHQTGFGLVRTVLPLSAAPIALGNSDQAKFKDPVYTIGQGEADATELVVLSRKLFAGSWEYLLNDPIYTFPPVNNWSGSALVNNKGELLGVGSLIVQDAANDTKGIAGNLFVPINLLKPILADLLSSGRRTSNAQPWLGMTTEVVRGNLTVIRVAKGGPAERAGVETGDIVVAAESKTVANQEELYKQVFARGGAGTTFKLRFTRQGQAREVDVQSIDRGDFLRKPTGT